MVTNSSLFLMNCSINIFAKSGNFEMDFDPDINFIEPPYRIIDFISSSKLKLSFEK